MNIYLDIDGVLLKDRTFEPTAPLYGREFLEYIFAHFPNTTYWLTTRCNGGEVKNISDLREAYGNEIFAKCSLIKPTKWQTAKTNAIDFSKRFLWLDDTLMEFEKEKLRKTGTLDNFVQINFRKDPKQLLDVLEQLSSGYLG